jgi:hypothetical protein
MKVGSRKSLSAETAICDHNAQHWLPMCGHLLCVDKATALLPDGESYIEDVKIGLGGWNGMRDWMSGGDAYPNKYGKQPEQYQGRSYENDHSLATPSASHPW